MAEFAAFALDLQAAKDYRAYLDDKQMIDLMMAAEPESAFTAGWIVTLLKARELGLDAQPASEDFRAGNDNLNGSAAADLLVGGAGNDALSGGAGNDRLNGGAGGDTLDGGAGNDILIGGSGGDGLIGGSGDDSFVVDTAGDVVVEHVNEGTDSVFASASFTLPAHVENLTLQESAGSANANGNALANVLTGNSGNNILTGDAGNDILTGGAGNDVFAFGPGHGADTIADFAAGAGNATISVMRLSAERRRRGMQANNLQRGVARNGRAGTKRERRATFGYPSPRGDDSTGWQSRRCVGVRLDIRPASRAKAEISRAC